ncbi:MAG: hypothetical protein HYZ53_20505 [Planctomycetes bacterium]|nr:hypothetical protein [Planctomycetota bacterium]
MPLDPDTLAYIDNAIDRRLTEVRVQRSEFDALVTTVRELANAVSELQVAVANLEKRMEEGFARVWEAIQALSEAQRRTEERLENGLKAMQEAIVRLEKGQEKMQATIEKMQATIEAMQAAIERLDRGYEANQQTIARLDRGYEELRQVVLRLDRGQDALRKEVGALSENFGWGLEEMGRAVIAHYLLHEHGIRVEGLDNTHFAVDGEEVEIDLFGRGRKDVEEVAVLAEVKARFYPRELAAFERNTERIMAGLGCRAIRILFGMRLHPEVKRRAKEAGIVLIPWDYQYKL